MVPTIHAFIISWSGQRAHAEAIEAAVAGHVERLTVIHSDAEPAPAPLGPNWIRTPNDWFFGLKFRRCLEAFDGDVMLQISADTTCEDWGRLVARCRTAFEHIERVGVWAPDVDHTYWSLPLISIGRVDQSAVHCVTLVNSVVWAIERGAAERMRGVDYECNNLGWGVDRLAALHCHVTDRLVLLDEGVKVKHPKGSGYDPHEAHLQGAAFMRAATPREQVQNALIEKFTDERRRVTGLD